eukprot:Plantae.Rhodophyta-Hildenbrandia_rubra.ctg2596.p1 GENE.Plantae.Rhodophyta-Hildenbrandia_rubra.ctg2596~~Plantae.Rhodophyta-Hildenbrandia_rubra.ctg2596.p1  ORF type:complete len:420 (+),score=83.62 Plantae.Rhodophyta-Hildenbrandia_rubra.ctg2596:117-1262(+)
MGIKGLTKLLGDNASRAMKEHELKSYFGRKVAIDASMSIYQFLVAVRTGADNLTNAAGDVTSHINGLFYRTVRLLELGIKPVYVFDGKPPPMKAGELLKRAEAKKKAADEAKKAEEEGNLEAVEKFSRRVNKVTPEILNQCKTVLRLMGVPVVEAPCEAEAQCAAMAKAELVYATASEDMDSLTFGTPRLLRQLWAGATSTAAKKGVKPMEFSLNVALEELELDMDKFIDLCILCGCDYIDSIRGVGPKSALNLIRDHGSLEAVIKHLRSSTKYNVPDEFPIETIRQLFIKPEVTGPSELKLKWKEPDESGLIDFMVTQNQFSETNVRSGIKRMKSAKKMANQGRMDSFFKRKAAPNADVIAKKRKLEKETAKSSKKTKKK